MDAEEILIRIRDCRKTGEAWKEPGINQSMIDAGCFPNGHYVRFVERLIAEYFHAKETR